MEKKFYMHLLILHDKKCPPPPDRSKGYVWKLYESFDIFLKDGNELKQLTDTPAMMQKQLFHQKEIKLFLPLYEMVILKFTQ